MVIITDKSINNNFAIRKHPILLRNSGFWVSTVVANRNLARHKRHHKQCNNYKKLNLIFLIQSNLDTTQHHTEYQR